MSYGIFNYENDEVGTCMMLIYDLDEQGTQQQASQQQSNVPKSQNLNRPLTQKHDDFSQKLPNDSVIRKQSSQNVSKPVSGLIRKVESYVATNSTSTPYLPQNQMNMFSPGTSTLPSPLSYATSPNTMFSVKNSQQQGEGGVQYNIFAKMMKNMDEETFKTYMQQFQYEQIQQQQQQIIQPGNKQKQNFM